MNNLQSPQIKNLQTLINIVQRVLILVMPAIFSVVLVACEPTTKIAADAVNPVNLFSHNSYTFAPANVDVFTGGRITQVASIFVNENEVKKLVAEQLRIGGDQDAITAISSSNYTLSYDIDAPSDSDANTFFAVEQNGSDPFQVDIFVADSTGVGLSFASIIQRVPGFNVEVSIQVPQATASRRIIKTSVRVAFQERDPSFSLDNTFTNDIARLSNNITFEPTAQVAENNRITAAATLSRRGNILSEYALQRNPETSSITVFLALRETANSNSRCGDGDIYLDNTDLRVKTARSYDYEVDPRPSYECRLSISEDGINYQRLVIVADATAISTISSRGNSIVGNLAPLPLNSNSVLSPPTSNSSIGCSATNDCYYADLNVEITNLDELPKIDASFAAFTPSNEGVGPRDVYEAAAVRVSVNDLASGTVADTSKRLTIIDRDWNPLTKVFLPVSEVIVAAVSPSHGRGAFTIEKVSALPNQYQLVVNQSLLDYELFSANQLTDGKAIYKISIRATDDPVADGGGSKSFTATFDFEVTDIVYRPLLVNSTIAAVDRLDSSTTAFSIESDIPTTQDNSIYVLSGAQALLNQLHRLGSFAAIDPETGDDRNLVYDIDYSSAPALAGNFGLINNSPRGRTLIISGTGLVQDDTGTLVLTSVHKNAQSIASPQEPPRARAEVVIAVNDESYRSSLTDRILSSGTPRFAEIPNGLIAEETVAAAVSYAGVSGGDLTTLVAPSDDLRFGFAPVSVLGSAAADLRQLGTSFATSRFAIDPNTGRITVSGAGLAFAEPYIHNLLVYVASAADFDAASNEATFLNNNASLYDVARVIVIVDDTNTAPFARSSTGAIINSTQPLAITIPEDQTAVGTEVARIMLSDDNDKTASDFDLTSAANSDPELFNIEWRDNGRGITGIVTLVRKLDYENDNDRALNAQTFMLEITDSGKYFYNSATGKTTPTVPLTNRETITLPITLDLRNVLEAPQLMAAADMGSIIESATTTTRVSSNTGGTELFNIINANEINATNLEYSVGSKFSGILEVRSRDLAGNRIPLELAVIDPTRLENLGDGRIFDITVTVKDLTSQLSDSIDLPIRILNDPDNDLTLAKVDFTGINITEQDAATAQLEIEGFAIPAIDIFRDYDDADIEGNADLQSLSFSVVVNPSPGLDPALLAMNVLEVFERDDAYFLRVTDRNFIEQSLFGDLTFTVNVRRTAAADTVPSLSKTGTLRVIPAIPKTISYADEQVAELSPPVYAFSYEQSQDAAMDSANGPRSYFINFAQPQEIVDISNDLDILVPSDPSTGGGLVDGTTEFNNYFTIGLINSTNPNDPPQLNITEIILEVDAGDGILVNRSSLDNIPLVAGVPGKQSRTLNYFIRSYREPRTINNANNYALAQFSVTVTAAGEIITNEYMVESFTASPLLSSALLQWTNPNNFTDSSISGLSINIHSYDNATDANATTSLITITEEGLLTPGPKTQEISSLESGKYYEFSITPIFVNSENQGIARTTSGARLLISNIRDYQVSTFAATATITGAQLIWTNPSNFADPDLTNITIEISEYMDAMGGIPINTTRIVNGTFLTSNQQTLDLALTLNRYYEFSIRPNFSVTNKRGIAVAITGPRVFTEEVRNYIITDLQVFSFAKAAVLQWQLPANLTETSLTDISITVQGYATADISGDPLETRTLTATSSQQSIEIPSLISGRYYKFFVTPNFDSIFDTGSIAEFPGEILLIEDDDPAAGSITITVTDLTGTVDISTDEDATAQISMEFIYAQTTNATALNGAQTAIAAGNLNYVLVSGGLETACSIAFPRNSNINGISNDSGNALNLELNLTAILTAECAAGIAPIGYAENFGPFDMIKSLVLEDLRITISDAADTLINRQYFGGDINLPGELTLMGDIAERTPIFVQDEYAIFIDINKLPSANTSLLNITATDAASYSITPTNLPADAIDPLVLNTTTGEISAGLNITDIPDIGTTRTYDYDLVATNSIGSSAPVTLRVIISVAAGFAADAYVLQLFKGQTGLLGNVTLASGLNLEDFTINLVSQDGSPYTKQLFSISASGEISTAEFLGKASLRAISDPPSIFQGPKAPDSYDLAVKATSITYAANTAQVDLTINVTDIPYRYTAPYSSNTSTTEDTTIISTLNSIYNQEYDVSYEVVTDSSNGLIMLNKPTALGATEIRMTNSMEQEEHVLVIREIIRARAGQPPQTYYGAENGTLFVLHIGRSRSTIPHLLNWWTKPDLRATFDSIGTLNVDVGDSLVLLCPDPRLEAAPTLLEIYWATETQARSCGVEGIVTDDGFAKPKIINSCNLYNSVADVTLESDRREDSLKASSGALPDAIVFRKGDDSVYIATFTPVNRSKYLEDEDESVTGPEILLSFDDPEFAFPYAPPNSICQERGLRMHLKTRP